jgi:hypothetical protein
MSGGGLGRQARLRRVPRYHHRPLQSRAPPGPLGGQLEGRLLSYSSLAQPALYVQGHAGSEQAARHLHIFSPVALTSSSQGPTLLRITAAQGGAGLGPAT